MKFLSQMPCVRLWSLYQLFLVQDIHWTDCCKGLTEDEHNFNNIYLILSGSEETSLWMGYDGFHDNVRKDLNYG